LAAPSWFGSGLTGRTVYQLKHGLLDDYLIQQMKNPSLKMVFA
jgi:hypothetical protein